MFWPAVSLTSCHWSVEKKKTVPEIINFPNDGPHYIFVRFSHVGGQFIIDQGSLSINLLKLFIQGVNADLCNVTEDSQ